MNSGCSAVPFVKLKQLSEDIPSFVQAGQCCTVQSMSADAHLQPGVKEKVADVDHGMQCGLQTQCLGQL